MKSNLYLCHVMSTKETILLAIESSCDDTSAAVIKEDKILANIVANQEIHKQYGGVVPELASRAHQQHIIPVVNEALKIANIQKEQLSAIVFTKGPGLLGSLLVGTSFAKSFAQGLNIPIITVNHMQAHILAHFIDDETMKKPPFPFLCLTVSGGHTQIVLIKDYLDMEVIGETLDDAAGEAFDKSAKILGLPYPGGPLIDKYAKLGNPKAFSFTKPKINGLNFSFSGLKTNILYFVQNNSQKNTDFVNENLYDLCASIQHTIIEILMEKIEAAAVKYNIKHIAIAGGVSANSGLRDSLKEREQSLRWTTYIPKFEYCTDNAGMIAIAGYYKFLNTQFDDLSVKAQARLQL